MAVLPNYYVDPAIAADSGSGTIGDPYGDLQYALNHISPGATGEQINIKAGTDELLTATLDFTTHGVPTTVTPLVLRGYTSVANDGGIGGINGNATATYLMNIAAGDGVYFRDLHLHNVSGGRLISLRNYIFFDNCDLEGTVGSIDYGVYAAILFMTNCRVHNMTVQYAAGCSIGRLSGNYFENGVDSFLTAAIRANTYASIYRNFFNLSGAQRAIYFSGSHGGEIFNNSILSSGGTSYGIQVNSNAGMIVNNCIEGYSGAGGIGIWAQYADANTLMAGNAVYNCTTPYSLTDQPYFYYEDNETLAATPFAKTGANTYANRLSYYAPADDMKAAGWPAGCNLDKGAVQHADPSVYYHRRPFLIGA